MTILDGVVGATEDKDLMDIWKPIRALESAMKELRGRLVEHWTARRTQVEVLDGTVKDIRQRIDGVTSETGRQLQKLRQKTDLYVLVALILTVVLLVAISLLVALRITRPVVRMTRAIEDMADGDFRVKIDVGSRDEIGLMARSLGRMAAAQQGKTELAQAIADGDLTRNVTLASERDELGHALKEMNARLSLVLSQAHEVVNQVADAATQMADSSQSLSMGATQQASSLEEMTSAMTQIGSQTKANADNAVSADQVAQEARRMAESGNTRMRQAIAAMGEIETSSKEIARIIKAIDDIAFQTNLLALNAAVEAARAGKHGKGFAVVAQEVRNLAGRSAKAAQETSELIEGSVNKVENGTTLVNQTATALADIKASVEKVTGLITGIAAASREQAGGIAEVNEGLQQVGKVTQLTTANAEETAAATDDLSHQANRLREVLSRFRLNVNHGRPASREAAAALPETTADRNPVEPADGGAGTKARPNDIIKLDDEEFGRF